MTQPPGPPRPYASPGTPPPKRRSTALIALAIVLGLGLILAASYVVSRVTAPSLAASPPILQESTTPPPPTVTPSATRVGFTLEGSVLSGPTFTARNPDGWVLAQANGVDNDGEIVKGRAMIIYSGPKTGTAQALCVDVIESFHTKYGGTVTDLTGTWGRRETVTKHLVAPGTDGREVSMLVWCVDRPNGQAASLMSATDTDHTNVAKDAVSLLSSWAWI